ncbi:Uncharacterised protein [Escherichia coli]|nr:Uncharacterised protein [Escherichia coli]
MMANTSHCEVVELHHHVTKKTCSTVPLRERHKEFIGVTCRIRNNSNAWTNPWALNIPDQVQPVNGKCPNQYQPVSCSGGAFCEGKWENYTVSRTETQCTNTNAGLMRSTITVPDNIELRSDQAPKIQVKGDCTNIQIESKEGKIIPHETRVCGTGEVQIRKQPGAEGADDVIIKAQLVQ